MINLEQTNKERLAPPTVSAVSTSAIKMAIMNETKIRVPIKSTGMLPNAYVDLKRIAADEMPEELSYSFHESQFGKCIIASSATDLNYIAFSSSDKQAVNELQLTYPDAALNYSVADSHLKALRFLNGHVHDNDPIVLRLPCTPFQFRVWQELMKIPKGSLTTYGKIAQRIDKPAAARAVGSAVGANKAAYIVPCHRVVPSSGELGGYMWGVKLKASILATELGSDKAVKPA